MSTRAIIEVLDERHGGTIVTLYHHSDGYPTWLGARLKRFLSRITMTVGLAFDQPNTANGMDDLAAQLICFLKRRKGRRAPEAGCLYITQPGHREEWLYKVWFVQETNALWLSVYYGESLAYDGPVKGFNPSKAEKKIYG